MILTLVFMTIGIGLIVLQTTVIQSLPVNFGHPDVIYLLVAFAAYRFAWLPGILISFSVGWIFDVLVGVNLGIYPLECLLAYGCLKLLASNTPVKSPAYEIPMVGISYFLLKVLMFFLTSLSTPDVLPAWSWGAMVRETLLLVLAAIPVFLLLNALYEYLERRIRQSKRTRRKPARSKAR